MISVALHLDDENSQSIRLFMNQHTLPQRFRISYVKDNSGHYPINRLRNVAINNTLTSHFWLTDIDIWPASDLYETLLSLPASLLSEDRQALIVPAYEVSYNSKQLKIVDKSKGINRNRDGVCTDLEGCFFKHLFMVPHHKEELLSCLAYGPCDIFKKQQLTHSSTDYERWERSSNRSEYAFDLECFKNEGYEPYVVVKRTVAFMTPRFDEQYVDYGMNKLIWIFRLRLAEYRFRVLLHSFAVHVPHPSSKLSGDMLSKRNSGKMTDMDFYMKEFVDDLKSKGIELKTVLPLCEGVESSLLWSRITE
ncbi:hypothetical protein WA577_003787 [Blastocystis sp. JDR]